MANEKIKENSTNRIETFWVNSRLVIAGILFCLLFLSIIVTIVDQNKRALVTACEKEDKIYDEKQKSCRAKTISEKFDEKCTINKNIDGESYTCSELKK